MAAKLVRSVYRVGFKSALFSNNIVSISKCSPLVISRTAATDTLPGLLYSQEHEWLKQEGDVATIGITNHAQDSLGDVVYCELPEVGTEVEKGDVCGTIESVKAVSDVFTPVSGEVVEVNTALTDQPELLNKQPYTDGWLFKLKMSNVDETKELMSEDEYKEFFVDS